jgi:hypothetical protein
MDIIFPITKFEKKYKCSCGTTTSKYNRTKHHETKKHIIWWINENYIFENEALKKEFIKNYFKGLP